MNYGHPAAFLDQYAVLMVHEKCSYESAA